MVLADDAVERALAVVAHPDDVDFWAGGTVACWTSAGTTVTYCVLSDGDSGGFDPHVPRSAIPGIRRTEQEAAAAVLGVSDVRFLGHPDGCMHRTCPACSARLDQHATSCPQCGTTLAAGGGNQTTETRADQEIRTTAMVAHLSTFAGLVVPFGSVIGPLAVWLTRRDRDPFIDQAGREALNFGITIAIYGSVLLVAALMLVGIPLLIVGVVAWVVVASLAAAKASQGQPYRYPLTMRLVR